MYKECPACGKRFDILYLDLWAYNINKKQFFCSYRCLQNYKNRQEEKTLGHITLEQKKKAVQILLEHGDVHGYLKECGSDNTGVTLSNIMKNLEKKDPETYDRIQAMYKKGKKVDKGMPKVKVDGPIVIETEKPETVTVEKVPEMPEVRLTGDGWTDEEIGKIEGMTEAIGMNCRITAPVSYDGFQVRGISGRFGSYHFQDINGRQWIDYEDNESSNELSMTVEQWREFLDELRRAALVLGVEL